jgi:hypothetical protein
MFDRREAMWPSFSVSSPMRSRSVMVLMTATISRRSDAVGLRVARMRLQSSSIDTSMALTLWSRRATSSPSRAVPRDEGLHAVLKLLLDEPAHLQDPGADALEVRVEAAQDVVRKVGRVHAGLQRSHSYIRSGVTVSRRDPHPACRPPSPADGGRGPR